jgi:hypothetical protein
MTVIAREPLAASNNAAVCDRSNLLKPHAEYEIAASTLKNDCFSFSPRNDDVKMKHEAVVK